MDHRALAPAAALVPALAWLGLACGQARPSPASASISPGCVGCHGTAGVAPNLPGTDPLLDAAPPLPPGGAHQAHVNPPASGAMAAPIACADCHDPVPTDPRHWLTPRPVVAFGARARAGGAQPTWAAPTCAGTACHGAFAFDGGDPGGPTGGKVVGSAFAPDWMQGSGQAACGTCHALPPAGHPPLSPRLGPPFDAASCSGCHADTVRPDGAIAVSAATGQSAHVDGRAQEGAHADPGWCVLSDGLGPAAGCAPEAAGRPRGGAHAAAALDFAPPSTGLRGCLLCHGVGGGDYGSADGRHASSCNACHASAGSPSWLSSCTFCHGAEGRVANLPGTDPLLAGAPPRGVAGESSTADPAVGAHQAHVNPSAATALAAPIACAACHDAGAPGSPHPGGPGPRVAFSGVAVAGGAAPTYDRASGCASTYCHGGYAPGGERAAPSWIGGAGQAACGSCHGLPPATGRVVQIGSGGAPMPLHQLHPSAGLSCGNCHPGYGYSVGPVNLALHVNGVADVGANVRTWDPATGTCTSCHAEARGWY